MMSIGTTSTSSAAADSTTSIGALEHALKPRSGTSLRLMIGMPSRSSSRARSAMNCSRSGTTLTSTPSRLVDLDEVEHLDVLVERQRDVEVVDLLALHDLGASASVPSSGRPR
jgi:hypothetical protein